MLVPILKPGVRPDLQVEIRQNDDDDHAAGLVFTVVKTDYEGSFLMMLQDCINLVSGANDIRSPPNHLLTQAGRIVGAIRAQRDKSDETNDDIWELLLDQPA